MGIRPAIRPGAALLRRDRDHLQVGTAPGYVILDQTGLIQVLRLFDGIRSVDTLAAALPDDVPEFAGDLGAIIVELVAAGVICDARQWDFPGRPFLSDEARFHCASGLPTSPIRHRDKYQVSLIHDAGALELATIVETVLTHSGIGTTTSADVDLTVMLSLGEPARGAFANASHYRLDHLPVVIDEERIRIGPFVQPSQTPCVQCYDRHRTDWDSAWPALATQFGRPTHTILTPAAVRATTLYVAAAEIAANVIAHCDGRQPATAGRLVAIGPGHDERTTWPVNFHPACGCSLLHVA